MFEFIDIVGGTLCKKNQWTTRILDINMGSWMSGVRASPSKA
jgi:hypothetical protein